MNISHTIIWQSIKWDYICMVITKRIKTLLTHNYAVGDSFPSTFTHWDSHHVVTGKTNVSTATGAIHTTFSNAALSVCGHSGNTGQEIHNTPPKYEWVKGRDGSNSLFLYVNESKSGIVLYENRLVYCSTSPNPIKIQPSAWSILFTPYRNGKTHHIVDIQNLGKAKSIAMAYYQEWLNITPPIYRLSRPC